MSGLQCLEARRAWLPGSKHDAKKSAERIALEGYVGAGTAGRKALAAMLRGFDLHYLLILLAESENRTMREGILTKVQAMLHLMMPAREPVEGDEWKGV